MNSLEDVPFRMASSFEDDSKREAHFVQELELEIPDCEELLTHTMPDFSLEKKVLDWVESTSWQDTPWYQVTPDVFPTAPSYEMLLVDSQESHEETSSRTEEEEEEEEDSPVQRCASPASNSETQPTSAESKQGDPPVYETKHVPGRLACFFGLPQPRPRTSPGLLAASSESNCPKPAPIKQSQTVLLLNNMKNELGRARGKMAALLNPLNQSLTKPSLASKAFSLHQRARNYRNLRYKSVSDASSVGNLTPTPPSTPCGTLRPLTSAGLSAPIQKHKPTAASLSPYACLPPLPGAQPTHGSHSSHRDSTADLLSALSQEERDLIEPALALGYPIYRAILTLQKTGTRSLGEFLGYLSACDKLLKEGYEEAQVEEAMEMFQNPEKAAEFLHLLARFNDMGFQQADIKEVLLLCENQSDNALEELMTRAQ